MSRFLPVLCVALMLPTLCLAQALNPGSGLPGTNTSKKSFFKSAGDSLLNQLQISPSLLSLIKNDDIRTLLELGKLDFARDTQNQDEYIATLNARSLALPDDMIEKLSDASLPTVIEQAELNAVFQLDQRWSQEALQSNGLKSITIENIQASMLDIEVIGTGSVQFDDLGLMFGAVQMQITNWQKLLPLIEFTSDAQRVLIENALMLASDGPKLDVTFDISESFLYFGVIPLTDIEIFKDF